MYFPYKRFPPNTKKKKLNSLLRSNIILRAVKSEKPHGYIKINKQKKK